MVDKRYFQGLPSPAAAALVVGFILMMSDPAINISARSVDWLSWVIAVFAGLSMVSNIPFYSFKDVNFKKSVPFIVVFLIALGFALCLARISPSRIWSWPARAYLALFNTH